jgi:Protein of unknown function (DUF1054)
MATPFRFPGFDPEDFETFRVPDRHLRREEILRVVHPKLQALGEDILSHFRKRGIEGLHPHLPHLNWPPGYQPFCTWLAFSTQPHRYQQLAQLNVGVHEPFVSVRLGFDTAGEGFGRFLFLMSHGDLPQVLARVAVPAGLRCRVYRRAPWPEGSRAVFDSGDDFLRGALAAEREGGNWFEVGRIFTRRDNGKELAEPEFAAAAAEILLTLYPVFRRLAGP